MKKYLTEVIEWGAHRILEMMVGRVHEIITEGEKTLELTAPKLPEIEHRIG